MIGFCAFLIAATATLYGSWAVVACYGDMFFNLACMLIGALICKLALYDPEFQKMINEMKEYLYDKRKIR